MTRESNVRCLGSERCKIREKDLKKLSDAASTSHFPDKYLASSVDLTRSDRKTFNHGSRKRPKTATVLSGRFEISGDFNKVPDSDIALLSPRTITEEWEQSKFHNVLEKTKSWELNGKLKHLSDYSSEITSHPKLISPNEVIKRNCISRKPSISDVESCFETVYLENKKIQTITSFPSELNTSQNRNTINRTNNSVLNNERKVRYVLSKKPSQEEIEDALDTGSAAQSHSPTLQHSPNTPQQDMESLPIQKNLGSTAQSHSPTFQHSPNSPQQDMESLPIQKNLRSTAQSHSPTFQHSPNSRQQDMESLPIQNQKESNHFLSKTESKTEVQYSSRKKSPHIREEVYSKETHSKKNNDFQPREERHRERKQEHRRDESDELSDDGSHLHPLTDKTERRWSRGSRSSKSDSKRLSRIIERSFDVDPYDLRLLAQILHNHPALVRPPPVEIVQLVQFYENNCYPQMYPGHNLCSHLPISTTTINGTVPMHFGHWDCLCQCQRCQPPEFFRIMRA